MEVEFWSTSFAAPKPPNMNLFVKLMYNYPTMPSISGKTVRSNFYLCVFFDRACSLPPPSHPPSLCVVLAGPPACSVGWWLVLVCSERRVLLAGCGWLLVAGSF
jgi:hypothetical protein